MSQSWLNYNSLNTTWCQVCWKTNSEEVRRDLHDSSLHGINHRQYKNDVTNWDLVRSTVGIRLDRWERSLHK